MVTDYSAPTAYGPVPGRFPLPLPTRPPSPPQPAPVPNDLPPARTLTWTLDRTGRFPRLG